MLFEVSGDTFDKLSRGHGQSQKKKIHTLKMTFEGMKVSILIPCLLKVLIQCNKEYCIAFVTYFNILLL